MRKDYTQGEAIETIYFGGGTPSLLDAAEIKSIFEAINDHYPVDPSAEITLEANPDDISNEKLESWKATGINRLSIGIQSFFEDELRWMNRAHNAEQARACIELSQGAGFHNISIDLIYGSPLLTNESWKENVSIATGYGIPHLSCYALTVEEKTPLHKQISQQKKEQVSDDNQANQFIMLMDWLEAAGYEHYEVSNFAKPGFRSRHNSAYWKGKTYLGIGPSAHSFDGKERSWNIANNTSYINGITAGTIPSEKEMLTPEQSFNENIMISLRTMEGIDLSSLENTWGNEERERVEKLSRPYLQDGYAGISNNRLKLTKKGMLLADGIASALFK